MNGFERRREQKKESIRLAALDMFKTHGIKKITVREIATRAGVSPVTIYNYFGSKQDLVRDVVKWFITDRASYFRSILASDRPFLERLGSIFSEKNATFRSYDAEVIQTLLSQDPDIKRSVEGILGEQNRTITAFFEEGKREGYIDGDISEQSLFLFMEAFRMMAYAHPDLFANPGENNRLLKELTRLYLYGIMGKESYPALLQNIQP